MSGRGTAASATSRKESESGLSLPRSDGPAPRHQAPRARRSQRDGSQPPRCTLKAQRCSSVLLHAPTARSFRAVLPSCALVADSHCSPLSSQAARHPSSPSNPHPLAFCAARSSVRPAAALRPLPALAASRRLPGRPQRVCPARRRRRAVRWRPTRRLERRPRRRGSLVPRRPRRRLPGIPPRRRPGASRAVRRPRRAAAALRRPSALAAAGSQDRRARQEEGGGR